MERTDALDALEEMGEAAATNVILSALEMVGK
jgi:hypothetical protein